MTHWGVNPSENHLELLVYSIMTLFVLMSAVAHDLRERRDFLRHGNLASALQC